MAALEQSGNELGDFYKQVHDVTRECVDKLSSITGLSCNDDMTNNPNAKCSARERTLNEVREEAKQFAKTIIKNKDL